MNEGTKTKVETPQVPDAWLDWFSLPSLSSDPSAVPGKALRGRLNIPAGDWVDQTNRAITKTMNEVNRVIQMIQHFRAVTDSAAGADGEGFKTSVHETVTQVLRAMRYEFPLNNIMIVKMLPHGLAPVKVKAEHLETLLFELLYRARQAVGGKRGIITIDVSESRKTGPGRSELRSLVFCITDTGETIDRKTLAHLFDPEFLMQNDSNGNMLSFFVVRKLTELYGGTVRVEARDQGTAVYLDLPA